jgi:hypothetical protein
VPARRLVQRSLGNWRPDGAYADGAYALDVPVDSRVIGVVELVSGPVLELEEGRSAEAPARVIARHLRVGDYVPDGYEFVASPTASGRYWYVERMR